MKSTKELDIILLDVVRLHELVLELQRDELAVRCHDEQEPRVLIVGGIVRHEALPDEAFHALILRELLS